MNIWSFDWFWFGSTFGYQWTSMQLLPSLHLVYLSWLHVTYPRYSYHINEFMISKKSFNVYGFSVHWMAIYHIQLPHQCDISFGNHWTKRVSVLEKNLWWVQLRHFENFLKKHWTTRGSVTKKNLWYTQLRIFCVNTAHDDFPQPLQPLNPRAPGK